MSTPQDPVERLLARDADEVDGNWQRIQRQLESRFGRTPGIEAALYLVGLRERGELRGRRYSKEAKQDLIMQGTYHAFERVGIYTRNAAGEWERIAPLPVLGADEQERLLKAALSAYFEDAWASE